MIGLVSMCICKLKGLNLGGKILQLGIHHGVGLIGGCDFSCVLGGGCCEFVLVDLEARHHLIYDGIGVVEAQFVNCSAGFPEFKASFSEVVFEIFPSLVRQVGAFPRPDVVL